MARKKWTAQTAVNPALLRAREKKKWQIALRRYVLEQQRSSFYAPYFGIGITGFRSWIALQFGTDLSWDGFSEQWQLDHVVPLSYFDLDKDTDLQLCWNFTNIRVHRLNSDKENGIDLLAARVYFEKLATAGDYHPCRLMLDRITRIEQTQDYLIEMSAGFLEKEREALKSLFYFTPYEYDQLNEGREIGDIVAERVLLEKFGGSEDVSE